ncbi:L-histidine N(alpha)-methyltransferase [Algiphilus sp.]|uniref:L-histidine N(alpha)-methyltransferase n=1 Tax=Algiphilus sp. TaxID=1872431 RepID=UPI003BA97473
MNNSAVTAVPAPQEPAVEDFAGDALAGLSAQPKTLPSKYLYDTRGSELFEAICEQPEYYPTRTELSILQDEAASMAEAVGPRALVVEYGSGSGIKTQRLLDALPDPVAYVPIEISHSALNASVAELATQFPEIEMLPLCADFLQPVRLPASERPAERVLIFFPGSTLGNFDTDAAVRLLTTMRTEMGDNGAALIGIDLKKDPAMIEAAYNDAAGVTADFTLNLLDRMNRELDADFDRERFTHRARYNAIAGRIETHIVSDCAQTVRVAGRPIAFTEGEGILVEYSCKYSQSDFAAMAHRAGLVVTRSWTDADRRFALQLVEPLPE